MKVMISRNEQGRALIRTVDGLNLQDLSRASDAQIRAVTNLTWEIKRLFYALIKEKASDVLADLNHWRGQAECESHCDLIASIPRRCGHQCAAAVAPYSRHGNGIEIGRRSGQQSNTYQLAGENQQTQTKSTPTKSAPAAVVAKSVSPQTASPQPASRLHRRSPHRRSPHRPSLKQRPERPIPRKPTPAIKRSPPTNRLGEGGGPNRRSAQSHGGRASRDRGSAQGRRRKQPSLNERPEETMPPPRRTQMRQPTRRRPRPVRSQPNCSAPARTSSGSNQYRGRQPW